MIRKSVCMVAAAALACGVGLLVGPEAATGRCTCYVQGKINREESCERTFLELLVWDGINDKWVFADSGTYDDGEIFLLFNDYGDACRNTGRLRSNGGWIYEEFNLTGTCSGDTTRLGNVYDYKGCVDPYP